MLMFYRANLAGAVLEPISHWCVTRQLGVCVLAAICVPPGPASQSPPTPTHSTVCHGVGDTFNTAYVAAIIACSVSAPGGASAVHVGQPNCERRAGLFRCAVTVTYQLLEAPRHEL